MYRLCVPLALACLLPATSIAADFSPVSTLTSESGWESLGTKTHKDADFEIDIRIKYVGERPCLVGEVDVSVSTKALLSVATDIEGALKWSSAPLDEARTLGHDGDVVHYFQLLDTPRWTLTKDRYWVLAGRTHRGADGTVAFQWNRFEWKERYPELVAELARDYEDAIEPPVNYGEWRFTPNKNGSTNVRYYVCSDTGGSLSEGIQKLASKETLPDTVADLVIEGRRR